MSSWIKMIDDSDADEDLNLALNQAKTPHGTGSGSRPTLYDGANLRHL